MKRKVDNTELIYDHLVDEWHDYQRTPSYREIAAACGLSVTTVIYHLEKLEGQGRIVREANKARSIRIVEPTDESLKDETTEEIYLFICQQIADGIVPTQTEIADGCYVSRSSVRRHLVRLEAQGKIRVGEGIRDLQLLDY